MKRNRLFLYLSTTLFLASCSMTKSIPDEEQLFTGLKNTVWLDEREDSFSTHLETTKEELEAAIATTPNGSLFGSTHFSLPWSWHLWVYNHYANKTSGFARWMTKSFGKAPVLVSQVNPALRASVAQSVLRNNGYFRGSVSYETVTQRNPKKAKIRYIVRLDSLFTYDSIAYVNFPDTLQQLIDSTRSEAVIHKGDAFTVSDLDGERSRISNLLRNNGYYFYNPGYASYLADTFAIADKTQLRFQLADGLPDEALRKWYIGNIGVSFRKNRMDQLTDSIRRRHLTIHYQGDHSPIRPVVVLKHLRLRPGQAYSYEKYIESATNINATGVFSSTDFLFTPRTDCNTLDLSLNCTFNKPYDFYIETTAIGRTNGRYGPELKIGFSKLNAFRGAEKLDINLHGAYQWQSTGGSKMSTYEYGADASLEFPRIIAPFYNSDRIHRDKNGRPKPHRFFATPTTYAKISSDVMRRPEYYKMHVVSGEWTYRWQSSERSRHEFSPLTLKYQFKNSTTEKYDSVVAANMYLSSTMQDYFIPKMRYTYTYTSPSTLHSPIRWETTIEESGNVVSLYDKARGKSFSEKDKTLFKTPYAQFLRLETDLTKTWSIGMTSSLVGHLNTGIIWSYGNSEDVPFSEMFYAGGPNSIRAFSARQIGPGRQDDLALFDKQFAYLMRNGDMKLIANLEYRTPLFGDLQGALFLDAGNVWNMRSVNMLNQFEGKDEKDIDPTEFLLAIMLQNWMDQAKFTPSKFFNDIALGTGIGLRYDLGFLVIRIDWGLALHFPYDTGKPGYFNIRRFKDMHTLNFAIGYPF